MKHHIEAIGLAYNYPDGTEVLQDLSFHIHYGEAVAVIGPNGAGKSTLLLCLTGCLTSGIGRIRIDDVFLDPTTLKTIHRRVGMVFQDPDDQLFMPSVFDDVAFGPLNLGLPPDEVKRHVSKALITVGADHLSCRASWKLSNGEKRSVAIATVLAMAPDILIMDEPSANLDPWSRRQLIGLLCRFNHTRIVATHDLDLALDVCPRTIVLNQGRIAADGPTATILTDLPLLTACHLEPPPRLQSCPRCGVIAKQKME
ncbi:putative ABC transporter ATP-binding protein GSU1281 [Desulfovibrionales bacterium]